MEKQMNVPRLRFSEFEGEWEVISIQELLDKEYIISHLDGNHGSLYPKNEEFTSYGVPYISANDFVNGIVDLKHCKFLPVEKACQFRKGIAKNGDVLFAHNATVGPTALLKTDLEFVILSTTATYFRCDNAKLYNLFLVEFFKTDFFVNQYSRVMAQSTRNQVPISMQRTFNIQIPFIQEQTKIASFLTPVGDKLTQLKKKKSLLEEYKKGVMQKIFSQELRFKDDNGEDFPEWEEKRLGDIATFSKGKGLSKADISDDGEIECIRYGELYTKYNEVINEVYSKTNVDKTKLVLSEANDVIIPASGETQIDIATASCVIKSGVALGGDLNIIKTINNGVFLSYYLNNRMKTEIANLAQGISVIHLYSKQLALLNISIPSLPEQTKIANFLSAIDEKINHCGKQIERMEEWKKGLLQQMFC